MYTNVFQKDVPSQVSRNGVYFSKHLSSDDGVVIPVGLGKNVDLGFCFQSRHWHPIWNEKRMFDYVKQCSTKIIFITVNGTKNIIYLINVMTCQTKTVVTLILT